MEKELGNIVEKASKLFNNYGIKSVSMDDVAAELGMSKKTLYQYVGEKTELIKKVIDYNFDIASAEVIAIMESNLNAIEELFDLNLLMLDKIRNTNPAIDYDLRKYYPELYEQLHIRKQSYIYDIIIANLQKGKNEGMYRQNLIIEIIAALNVSRMHHFQASMENTFAELKTYTTTQIFNEIFIYHIRGICTKKGIDLFKDKFREFKTATQ